jgi:hypothetical protein
MIEQLEKYTAQGRNYGAGSYGVSGDFLLGLLNRLKADEATINRLHALLKIERAAGIMRDAE